MKQKLSYCGQVVREFDPDRFLLSIFSPAASREDLWALFAFNHEIAKTREVVSETQLGLIRLQWWREAIEAIYSGGDVPEHQVVQPLAGVIARYDLPKGHFEMLLHAREFDLEDVLPGNVEGLLHYLDFTTTPLMKLAVQICGRDPDGEPVHAVAVNYGLAGILRAVPFHAGQRRCYLPEDLMKAHGQRLDHLYEGKPGEHLPKIVKTVAGQAVAGVRCETPFLKVSQRFSAIYLKKLEKCGYDVFSARMRVPPALLAFRLLFSLWN